MSNQLSQSTLTILSNQVHPKSHSRVLHHLVSKGGKTLYRRVQYRTVDGGNTFEPLEKAQWQQQSTIDRDWSNCNEAASSRLEEEFQKIWTGSGSPYDRGRADSYYRRGSYPHFIQQFPSNGSLKVDESGMTKTQLERYYQGYEDNEYDRDFKEWE
jgi:hypothetical protein